MITLTDELFIGRGYERACYRHPRDKDLCIKVAETRRIPRKQQNPVEYEYYNKLLARNIDWSHIARCHGWIDTDRGRGLVFDLKHDGNGNALPNLKVVLEKKLVDYEEIKPALTALYRYLRRNRIIVSGLKPANIVCDLRSPESPNLFIVDGVKNDDYFKIAEYVPFLAEMKIARIWRKFQAKAALTIESSCSRDMVGAPSVGFSPYLEKPHTPR